LLPGSRNQPEIAMRRTSPKLVKATSKTRFEQLENRQMMSSAVIIYPIVTPYVINGTNANDSITVSFGGQDPVLDGGLMARVVLPPTGINNNALTVTLNGSTWTTTLAAGQGVQVNGLGGNDLIKSTGTKGISIYAGAGNDIVSGAFGADYFSGGDGSDTVDYSGRFNNLSLTLDGVANDGGATEKDNIATDIEIIKAGLGNNMILGSTSAPTNVVYQFFGNIGRDTIVGGRGNDIINGGGGNDLIGGSYGNDTIHGGAGDDQVSGNEGNDVLYADSGVDDVWGDAGDDRLYGGRNPSFLHGGAGNDVMVSIGGSKIDRQWGDAGTDNFWLDSESTECVMDASSTEKAKTVHRVSTFAALKINGSSVGTPSRELLGQNLPDPQTTVETSSTGARYAYKNFKDKPLFASGRPLAEDIHQGMIGDCYFLAPLSGIAKTSPEVIQRSVVDLGDGTYAVQLKRNGVNNFVRVDADLPVTKGGSVAYNGLGNVKDTLWGAIMEKAWAFFRNSTGTYNGIKSGIPQETFKTLGMSNDYYHPEAWYVIDESTQEFGRHLESLLKDGKVVILATDGEGGYLEAPHGYSVDKVIKDSTGKITHVRLRNPWGTDGKSGDSTNDGYITVPTSWALKSTDYVVWGKA
jgi:hypothetical protein